MANKIRVFEVKTKDKKGNTITSVNIFGPLLPEPNLKPVTDHEAIIKKIKVKKPKD